MPYVYGDLSGSDDSNVLVAACYLGKDEEWQAATEAWKRVLDDAGIRGAFHATDFFSGRKLFAGKEWDPKGGKHQEYAARFTAVAVDAGLIGFAFAVDL